MAELAPPPGFKPVGDDNMAPPPGFKPIEAPPGFKPLGEAKAAPLPAPVLPGRGSEISASSATKAGDERLEKMPPDIRVSPTGELYSPDPDTQRQIMSGQIDFQKAAAAGVLQRPLGIAQYVLPESWQNENWAKWSKGLKEFGRPAEGYTSEAMDPHGAGQLAFDVAAMGPVSRMLSGAARAVGTGYDALKGYLGIAETGTKAAPVLAESAGAASKGVEQIADELKNLKPSTMEKMREALGYTAKSVAAGTAAGAVSGATEMRPEETEAERKEARAASTEDQAFYGSLAGLLPPGIKGAIAAGRQLTGAERREFSELVEKALNTLKEKTMGYVESGQLSASEQARLATEKGAAATKELTAAEKEAQRLTEVQQKIARSEETRAAQQRDERLARDPNDPRSVLSMQESISEKLRTRAGDARAAAERAGLPKAEAEAYVAEIKTTYETAQKELDTLLQSYATRPTKDPIQFGKDVEALVARTEKELMDARKTVFNDFDRLHSTNKTMPTDDLVATIDKRLASGVSSTEEAALARTKKFIEEQGADGYLTPSQMNNLRLYYLGDSPEAAKVARTALDEIPEFVSAQKNYAELSGPLDPYEHAKGTFAGVTEKEYGRESRSKMAKGEIVAQVLNRAAKGREGLAELVAANPELKESAREYFNGLLIGNYSDKAVTPQRLAAFMEKNGAALKEIGLFDEFKNLTAEGLAAQRKAATLGADVKTAETLVKEATDVEKAAQMRAERERALKNIQEQRQTAIEAGKPFVFPNTKETLPVQQQPGGPLLPTKEQVAEKAAERTAAAQERTAEALKAAEERQVGPRKTAEQAAKELERAQKMGRELQTFKTEIDNTRPEDLPERLEGIIKKLGRDEIVGDETYGKLLKDLNIAKTEYERAKDLEKFSANVRTALTAAATGYAASATGLGRAFRGMFGL